MDFPQYRKLAGHVYYRINDERSFDEIKIVGSGAFYYRIRAVQYPEIIRIREMLNYQLKGLEASDEDEFKQLKEKYFL